MISEAGVIISLAIEDRCRLCFSRFPVLKTEGWQLDVNVFIPVHTHTQKKYKPVLHVTESSISACSLAV